MQSLKDKGTPGSRPLLLPPSKDLWTYTAGTQAERPEKSRDGPLACGRLLSPHPAIRVLQCNVRSSNQGLCWGLCHCKHVRKAEAQKRETPLPPLPILQGESIGHTCPTLATLGLLPHPGTTANIRDPLSCWLSGSARVLPSGGPAGTSPHEGPGHGTHCVVRKLRLGVADVSGPH